MRSRASHIRWAPGWESVNRHRALARWSAAPAVPYHGMSESEPRMFGRLCLVGVAVLSATAGACGGPTGNEDAATDAPRADASGGHGGGNGGAAGGSAGKGGSGGTGAAG